ncbi:hypothetical protein SLS60_007220 [Paraconiothyrium brasiliense]|uniref:Uncharacterized protein n=1 Tax=Paraconiothyrium brasiliense TaxID=300254 RepID=A0ABR3R922_9PLEO
MADKQRQKGTTSPAASNESHKRKAEKDVDKPENAKILKTAQIKPQPTVFIQAMVVGQIGDDDWGFLVGKRAAAPDVDYVLEQSDLKVVTPECPNGKDVSIFNTVNDVATDYVTGEKRHLVTTFVICNRVTDRGKKPQVRKPDVYSQWKFRSWDLIPGFYATFSSLIKLRENLHVDWDNSAVDYDGKLVWNTEENSRYLTPA